MTEIRKYRKNSDPVLDEDHRQAEAFGKVRVGRSNLYWKRLLAVEYLPVDEIVRIYRRVEDVQGRTGCCSNDFSIHKLMVETRDGQLQEILIGEGLYRHEPEKLMEYLQGNFPDISYSKELTT